MAWGTVNVQEQRIRFVVCASRREKPLGQLCQEFQISRPTGYDWLRRYKAGGIAGVVEKSRRPHHSPGQTAAEVEQRVVELRQQRPDWGARKLQVMLEREAIGLPAITIHRILLRDDLVRPQDRQRAAVQRFQRAAANQLWQMDFKGPVGWGAPVGPLSVLDDHSRYAIALQGTWSTKAEPVREQLEEAFQRCGVPQEMLMDHGTPWWNMRALTGWTWLTVWLMKQGIRMHFSGYQHPQTQGKDLFLRGLTGRNLQLIVTDGGKGLRAALPMVYPRIPLQLCCAHKMRNIAGKVRRQEGSCVAEAAAIYRASSKKEALLAFGRWQQTWEPLRPGAVACVQRNLDNLLSFFNVPESHWKKVRTTNVIERAFREVRRRTRPMSSFSNLEKPLR